MNPMRMRPRDAQDGGHHGVSRRLFLKASAALGAGLTLNIYTGAAAAQAAAGANVDPNAFVRIGSDNTVTVLVKHLEMGQGTFTGLPTLVAEEMDASWAQVRAVGAPAVRSWRRGARERAQRRGVDLAVGLKALPYVGLGKIVSLK